MFNNDFDPYDVLVTLTERITVLEQAHNNLAHAYEKTHGELRVLREKHRNLEKSHMALANHVFKDELDKLNAVK